MESGKVMTPSPTEAPAEKFADVSRDLHSADCAGGFASISGV